MSCTKLSFLPFIIAAHVFAEELHVGVGAADITPPIGAPIAGYYSARGAVGTHDPLQAKALALQSGGTTAIMIICDLISMPRQITEETRKLVSDQLNVPGSNVMISATHSHTGPVLSSGSARDPAMGGESGIAIKYRNELPAQLAAVAQKAYRNLQRAFVRAGEGIESELSFNRRFLMKDGTVGWNAGKLNPNIVKPAGPIDPAVPIVCFDDLKSNTFATYVNFAMHLDTVGGLEYSADYPFALSEVLSRVKGPKHLTLFSIGTAGDINHINVSSKEPQKGHGEAFRIGAILAAAVLKADAKSHPLPSTTLRTRLGTVFLDLPPVTEADVSRARSVILRSGKDEPKFMDKVEAFKVLDVYGRQGKPLEVEVQVVALGDELAWVSLPGEIFVELGLAIKKGSPFKHTILVELANTSVGYIPTRKGFAQGNYEPISARCAPGSGEKIVETALALLKDLK